MDINEAKKLGVAELKSRIHEMQNEPSHDPNHWVVYNNALSELEYEEGKKEELAAITEEKLHQEITFAIPGVDFTALPAEVIELAALIVKHDRKKLLDEHSAELLSLHTTAKEEERAADERESQLRRQNDDLQGKITDVERELVDVRFSLEKMTEQRDNAAKQIDEQAGEIERLNRVVDEYQKAKVFGERQAQQIIDITPGESDAGSIQALINKIAQRNAESITKAKEDAAKAYIKVTSKEKISSSTVRVVLATTGEVKDINWIEHGKYVLVDAQEAAEEAERFRIEQAKLVEQPTQETGVTLGVEAGEQQSFPLPEIDNTYRLDDRNVGASVADGATEETARTVEERLTALEVAVFGKAKGAA